MKIRIAILISISSYLTLLTGCNTDGVGCFNDGGEMISVQMDVPSFTALDVATNIDVEISTKGLNLVELTTGENLVAGISMKVEEGVLKIKNLNTCFFARGYEKPLIKIRNANLARIVQHGYGRIFSIDTLQMAELSIQVEDASGAVELILDTEQVSIVSNSIGPIILKGKVKNLKIGHYWSDGIFYGKELHVQNCSVNHNGSNRMNINVVNKLTGSINSIGSVYLYGQPPTIIDVNLTNRGEVIEKY